MVSVTNELLIVSVRLRSVTVHSGKKNYFRKKSGFILNLTETDHAIYKNWDMCSQTLKHERRARLSTHDSVESEIRRYR